MELKNEIQEEDKSCENKYEARVIKIKFTHLLIAIILAIVIIGIVLYININIKSSISSIESDTNNSNDNISNEIEENSEQDKMYITQESSVSPSGKEFIGVFSDNLKEVYEGGTSTSKNFEFITYNTTNENIKQYSRLTKIKNNVTGNYDIVEKSSYYYNDLNKKIIASERIINDVTNYSIALQNKNTTYQEYIYNFFNSSVNIFQDLHNNNEEDNIARANKYYEYSDNVTKTVGNRGGNFNYENRTFDYEIMAYDVLYVYVTYPTNSNKEEILLLAYDENTEPEEVIKKWYQNVSTVQTTNTITSNLLEQIYAKYPEYEGKEGFICTDGEDYWLLDELGKKMYFYNLDEFEAVLKKHNDINVSTNNQNNTSTNTNDIVNNSNEMVQENKKHKINISDIVPECYPEFSQAKSLIEQRGLNVNEIVERENIQFIYKRQEDSWNYQNVAYFYEEGEKVNIIHTIYVASESTIRFRVNLYGVENQTKKRPLLSHNINDGGVDVYFNGKLAFTYTSRQLGSTSDAYEYKLPPNQNVEVKLVSRYYCDMVTDNIVDEEFVIDEYTIDTSNFFYQYYDLYDKTSWYFGM